MTNGDHLDLLKQGANAWNEWRRQNPGIRPELDLANLSLVSLSHANLKWAHLSRVNFQWANLNRVDLKWAQLVLANLSQANLKRAVLNRANLKWADLSQVNLVQANLQWADLSFANLSKANLSNADLKDAALNFANLSGADLSGANLTGANLTGANLTGANLAEANLTEANLIGAKVVGTNFAQTILLRACLDAWVAGDHNQLDVAIGNDDALRDIHHGTDLTLVSHHSKPHLSEANELFQEESDKYSTVDLPFREGIDWKAFLLSFKSLQAKYGEHTLVIQAIEHRSDRLLIVRLAVLAELDATDITRHAEKYYTNQLSALKSAYRRALQATDEQLATHWQHGINLLEIVKLQAAKPVLVESETSAEESVSPKSPKKATETTSPANGSSYPQIGSVSPSQNTHPTHPSVRNLTLPPQHNSIPPATKSASLTPNPHPLRSPTKKKSPLLGNKSLFPAVRNAALNLEPGPIPPHVSNKATPTPSQPSLPPPNGGGGLNPAPKSVLPGAENLSPIPGPHASRPPKPSTASVDVAPTLNLDPVYPFADPEDPSPEKESASKPDPSPPERPNQSPRRPANLGLEAYEPPEVDFI